MAIPTRSNSEIIESSWFNLIKTEIEELSFSTAIKVADFTLSSTDKLVTVDTSTVNITGTLPILAGNEGKNYILKKTDANAHDVILVGAGADKIDGVASKTLPAQYDYIWVVAGATEWHTVSVDFATLVNKILTTPDINGGTVDSLTSLSIRSSGAAQDLILAISEVITADRTLTISVADGSRTLTVSGDANIDQDLRKTQTPTFQGITRDSASIKISTTTTGNVILDSAANLITVSSNEDTDASTQTIKFGNDTGGISGLRNENGIMQFQNLGGGWNALGSGGGGSTLTLSSKGANYTITDADGIDMVLATAGGITITLPTAADNSGRVIRVKKTDTGTDTVTIDGEGAETIDGSATVIMSTRYQALSIVCDGVAWQTIVHYEPKVCVDYTGNAGESISADTTNIPFANVIKDPYSSWSGSEFTSPKSTFYSFTGMINISPSASLQLSIYVDTGGGYNEAREVSSTPSGVTNHSFVGGYWLDLGDKMALRSFSNVTLSNASVDHWIAIVGQ